MILFTCSSRTKLEDQKAEHQLPLGSRQDWMERGSWQLAGMTGKFCVFIGVVPTQMLLFVKTQNVHLRSVSFVN